jgi:hypothetical protein
VKRTRLAGFLAVALGAGACTRVVDAVTATNVTTTCTPQSTDSDCKPTGWPVGTHTFNSDPWLVTHNQVITSMKPNVLVLNFDNGQSHSETLAYANQIAAALAAGSIYHGYSDSSAPTFLTYNVTKVVDLTDSSTSGTVSANTPVTTTGAFDPTALFNDPRFPPFYGYSDSNGGYLGLCDLFEKGYVNEVWIQDGGDEQTTPRAPLYAERKQMYDQNGNAISGGFQQCTGGFSGGETVFCLNVPCNVTVRLAHLDPSPAGGPGCDVQVRGWGIEGMWTALPTSLADANAFLNQDFNTRFGVDFAGWPEICITGTCVAYPNPNRAINGPDETSDTFDISPFTQGCGSSLFPPNATKRSELQSTITVNSRCEHFGLLDGTNGMDTYLPYSNSVVSAYDQMYTGNSQCPAGWQIYWRQSMPGYQNQAKATDKTPMKNWWPMLFY